MITRKCNTCGEVKALIDYYAHSSLPGGRMPKCKECHKAYVRAWYARTRPARAEYERRRFLRPDRKSDVLKYQRVRRAKYPEKNAARNAVSNAVRGGKLKRLPCEVCGSTKSQAHHHDYSKPLDVRWLCFKHHREEAHGQTTVAQQEKEAA